jgi:prolyl-tRNA synthetase
MTHGDDRGLVLPSKIAPDQIRIIPVNDNGEVLETAIDLKTVLSEKYRVAIDQSAKTFGYKMNEAEIQGVPLRIEIGPRDLANNQVTISRRDTGEKQLVALKDVAAIIPDLLTAYDQNLYDLALANREARTYRAKTFQEYLEIINTRPGFVLVPFCGRVEDEEAIKQESATNSRCIPFEYEADEQPCFHCGRPTTLKVYFGRAY